MNKEEIEILEKLNNLKTKYIYQRYNGIITKYEVRDNYLIDTGNANNMIDINTQIPLGETSENIIDLIELGDIVNGCEVVSDKYKYIEMNFINVDSEISYGWGTGAIPESEIKTILTHEQYEQNCYKVGDIE